MKKIHAEMADNINGSGPIWNSVLYTSLIGQGINGILELVNQIIYQNNNNPYFNRSSVYYDTAGKFYLRGQQSPYSSTLSFGI